MSQGTGFSKHTVNKVVGWDRLPESYYERDLDELEHEKWLRDNVPPHHG
jgi:hypothetical protein